MPTTSVHDSSSNVDSFTTGTSLPASGTVTSTRTEAPGPPSSTASVFPTIIDASGATTDFSISASPISGVTLDVPQSSQTTESSRLSLIIIALATTTGALLLIGFGLFLRQRRQKSSTSSIVPFQSARRSSSSPSTDTEVATQEHPPEASASQLKASIFPAEKMPADRSETQPLERNIPISTVTIPTLPTVPTQRSGAGGIEASWEDAQILMSLDVPPSYESVRPRSYSQS